MAEYTEREALLNSICYETCGIAFCGATNCAFIAKICSAPAADVSQVVHGRWENGNPICPVCGEDKFKDLDADIWCDWLPPFCPNCGAKMDGGVGNAKSV